jgi:hypothetical protein
MYAALSMHVHAVVYLCAYVICVWIADSVCAVRIVSVERLITARVTLIAYAMHANS